MTETAFHPEIDRRQELQEVIRTADYSILDVGTGSTAMHEWLRRPHGTDSVYVGWNIDSKQHKLLADNIDEGTPAYAVIAGIPLRDSEGKYVEGSIMDFIERDSIDEVVMANVFGEPDSNRNYAGHPALNRWSIEYKGNSGVGEKVKTMQAALDLMKPGGKLTIVEAITPYKAPTVDALVDVLSGALGMEISLVLEQEDEADRVALFEQLTAYGQHIHPLQHDSFMIVATKPEVEG